MELRETGRVLVIDGHLEHFSEPFCGVRFSIVAFLHSSTSHVDESDRQYFRDLGFELPGRSIVTTHLSR